MTSESPDAVSVNGTDGQAEAPLGMRNTEGKAMAGLTNRIEQFLLQMMEEGDEGMIEIGRNDLAQRFACAPSQINYVLTTRFTPYHGYYTESRRGGSGYIRIIRLERSPEELVEEVLDDVVQDAVTVDKARHILDSFLDQGLLTDRECQLMMLAMDDHALTDVPFAERNRVRARILRNMLIILLR